jgi:hypothetical protein
MAWSTAFAQAWRPLALHSEFGEVPIPEPYTSVGHTEVYNSFCANESSRSKSESSSSSRMFSDDEDDSSESMSSSCPSSTVDTYMRGSQEASRSSNSTTGDGLLHLLQFPPHSYSQNYNGGEGWNNDFCGQTDCRQSTKIGYSDRRHAQSFAKFLILHTTTHALFQFCEISW